jgi:hypothetical protein
MGRHVLTAQERLRGIRAAIASPRTPKHLRASLRKQAKILQARAGSSKRKDKNENRRKRRPWTWDEGDAVL